MGAIQAVAPSLGIDVIPVNVHEVGEVERTLAVFAPLLEWRPDRDWQRIGGS